MGNHFSNIIMVPVSVFVISAIGWRSMFAVFAGVTWVFVLLPSTILMRRRPEDLGLHPDGIDSIDPSEQTHENDGPTVQEDHPPQPILEPVWSRREAMATGVFWVLAFSFAINSMAFQGMNISLVPYIQDLGYDDTLLAAVLTFRSCIMATSSLVIGFLAERAKRSQHARLPF